MGKPSGQQNSTVNSFFPLWMEKKITPFFQRIITLTHTSHSEALCRLIAECSPKNEMRAFLHTIFWVDPLTVQRLVDSRKILLLEAHRLDAPGPNSRTHTAVSILIFILDANLHKDIRRMARPPPPLSKCTPLDRPKCYKYSFNLARIAVEPTTLVACRL